MAMGNDNLAGLSELAEATGYARDYLAYLCRSGQIAAQKRGRAWLTSLAEIERYRGRVRSDQESRWEEMSRQQSLELREEQEYFQPRRERTWDQVLAGGAESAIQSFSGVFTVLLGWPLKVVLFGAHLLFRGVYAFFNAPIHLESFFGFAPKYYRLATKPVAMLYGTYGEDYSVYRLTRVAASVRTTSAYALGVFVAFIWLGVGAASTSSSFSEIPPKVALGAEATISQPYALAQSFLAGRRVVKEIVIARHMPARDTILVKDYLALGLPRVEGQVAGATITGDDESMVYKKIAQKYYDFSNRAKAFFADYQEVLENKFIILRGSYPGSELNRIMENIKSQISGITVPVP